MKALVTGSTGFLGSMVCQMGRSAGHGVVGACRSGGDDQTITTDLSVAGTSEELVESVDPEVVIHLAAIADIRPCEENPQMARLLNEKTAGELARVCSERGIRLLHCSTDQVFDGSRGGWSEKDEPRPLHCYGETKRAGEKAVMDANPDAVIVRPGLITGLAPPGRRSSSSSLLESLHAGRSPTMFTDELRSPVAAVDVARVFWDMATGEKVAGIFHCGGPEPMSRFDLAVREAKAAGFSREAITPVLQVDVGFDGTRPKDLTLESDRLREWLGWTPRALVSGEAGSEIQ